MEQPYLYYITWGDGGSPTPSILPKELQACEYLESSGTQYIILNNDIIVNNFESFEIKTQVNYSTLGGTTVFGSRETYNGNSLQLYAGNNNYQLRYFTQNTTPTFDLRVPSGSILEMSYDFNTKTVIGNGISQIYNFVVQRNITKPLMLFGFLNINTPSILSNGKIFYFRSNLFNLISCYVKSGKTFVDNKGNACQAGTPGMFDIVNNVFYTNDGTGAFTVGPDIII